MIIWMSSLGFLSAFALGPASFNIIRHLISTRKWPWPSILGFLLGDIFYIGLALVLLKEPFFQEPWIKVTLTALTVLSLSIYSVRILFFPSKSIFQEEETLNQGFTQSLLLTLANFHLVLIYLGLFLNILTKVPQGLFLGVGSYLLSFILGFMAVLSLCMRLQKVLHKGLRRIEVFAAYGFLTFSIYLSLEIL